MKALVSLILAFSAASANAETIYTYLSRRSGEVCGDDSGRISTVDLERMLKASNAQGSCGIFRITRFPTVKDSTMSAIDGYNGPITSIDLISNSAPTENISALTLRLRDLPLCTSQDGNTLSIYYGLSADESRAYQNPVGNLLYIALRGQQHLSRHVLFEFINGNLAFSMLSDFDNNAVSTFKCGTPLFLKK